MRKLSCASCRCFPIPLEAAFLKIVYLKDIGVTYYVEMIRLENNTPQGSRETRINMTMARTYFK